MICSALLTSQKSRNVQAAYTPRKKNNRPDQKFSEINKSKQGRRNHKRRATTTHRSTTTHPLLHPSKPFVSHSVTHRINQVSHAVVQEKVPIREEKTRGTRTNERCCSCSSCCHRDSFDSNLSHNHHFNNSF